MNGYIKLYRKLTQWGWYQDSVVKDLFLHLLLTASFKDFEWQGKTLKAGQLITGRKRLAEELNFSERQIRTALDKLKSTGELTTETTNKFTIITVVNWDEYQICEEEATNTSANERPTSDQQTTNKRPHIKNIKNDKNVKEGKEDEERATSSSFVDLCWEDEKSALEMLMGLPQENLTAFTEVSSRIVEKYFKKKINSYHKAKMYWLLCELHTPTMSAEDLQLLELAFEIAEANGCVKYNYLEGIFRNWADNGIHTFSDYKRHEIKRRIVK